MDPFNYYVLCNPKKNWLELEFRSENDEPIDGLEVTIQLKNAADNYTQISRDGRVTFSDIAAGEWRASITTPSLLTEVEKYASRKDDTPSPVKSRAETELGAAHKNPKSYHLTTVGDFWDTPPDDAFLQDHHKGMDINASEESPGFRLCHNQTYVFEIKALRSYMPLIVDTDEYSLVNSYTFALLAQQAYADNKFGVPRDEKVPEGGHDSLFDALRQKQRPVYSADGKVDWLVTEIPYSQHLKMRYYHDEKIGAEGYIFSNDEIAIIGVRGTETDFDNDDIFKLRSESRTLVADIGSGLPVLKIAEVADGVTAFLTSAGLQDVSTDLSFSQISIPEFGNTYVHEGFYQYARALWVPIDDVILKHHKNKKFYLCAHSLGGAGALLLSALIKDTYHPSQLRLYTYGMPRTGTHSFINRYRDIHHYRHVNNHDLVPQVPMRWMNSNPEDKYENSSVWSYFYPLVSPSYSLIETVVDNDDDNYQHHGNLIQLLTYSKAKLQPEAVKQILLTEKQTHIASLTIASNKAKDSYRLGDSLNGDFMDINGYSDTVARSGNEHKMSEYVPNLKAQLILLLNETLAESHESALEVISNTERLLIKTFEELKLGQIDAFGMHYVMHKNPNLRLKEEQKYNQILFKIKQELEVTETLLWNIQRVKKELQTLGQKPAQLSVDNLLFGDNSLDKQKIQEQLQ